MKFCLRMRCQSSRFYHEIHWNSTFLLAPKMKLLFSSFFSAAAQLFSLSLVYVSFSARVSYHFAVCSSLSIAINHFDTHTTDTHSQKFRMCDSSFFFALLFSSLLFFHSDTHMLTINSYDAHHYMHTHETANTQNTTEQPICVITVVVFLFFLFSLSRVFPHALRFGYAKLFLRLSSARRDDRLDVFRTTTYNHILRTDRMCQCVRAHRNCICRRIRIQNSN